MNKIILVVTESRESYSDGYVPHILKTQIFSGGAYKKAEAAFRSAVECYIPDWEENYEGDVEENLIPQDIYEQGISNEQYSINLVFEGETDGTYTRPTYLKA